MAKASASNRKRISRSIAEQEAVGSKLTALFSSLRWKIAAIGLSLLLQILIFPPLDVWPLAFICFVPWILMVGAADHARRTYLLSYLLGVLFFAISMRWLYLVTVPGALMLFAAMALYFPLVACPIRHVIRRRRIPLAIVFPAVWTGCEALRSIVVPRFPWCLLGHSQHSVLSMIQVSDLVGAYGVSFAVASVNGFVVDWIIWRWGRPGPQAHRRQARMWPSAAITATVMLATVGYGVYRLSVDKMTDGPRIAIVQGNYPNYVDESRARSAPTMIERADRYFALTMEAAQYEPDLFLLPETPWMMVLNESFLKRPLEQWYAGVYAPQECFKAFSTIASSAEAFLVTGATSLEVTPLDVRASERRYNSSFVFHPDGHMPERYDKIHLVFIGEYVPFRYGPLRFLYLWINRIMPFGGEDHEYSLTPGNEYKVFEITARSQNDRAYHFATPICYENVMPYISRRFALGDDGNKRCDFLLNLSNDGWFAHSSEQPQHLAASVFRAVENRVGVARAVNTGISCFIDPDGRVHDVVTRNGVVVGPGVDGYRVSNVKVSPRLTLYTRIGDIFAIICACVWGYFYVDYIVARIRESRTESEIST